MISVLVAAIAMQGAGGEPPAMRPGQGGRGRDPWTFRTIFEDRTRMLILAPAPDWWMAFNPETGAMHKVWRGKMDFRGKVWDFSQDNSRAAGRIYLASPSEIWRLPDDGKLPPGWTAQGVTFANRNWTFAEGASLTSPAVDASGWHRVFVAFDETSRKGRFRVTVSGDKPQWFESATSVGSDNDWQWNFKRIERPGAEMTVTLESPVAKRLRGLRLYGDRPSWFDGKGRELVVLWDGYELVRRTEAVKIRFRLRWPSGQEATVVHQPDLTPAGWQEKWRVGGIPKGETLTMRREGLSEAVRVEAGAFYAAGMFRFSNNGDYYAQFNLPVGER
ncbi:MAG: hypothetical protein ACO1SV_13185 [Fimbriimonas sp.]